MGLVEKTRRVKTAIFEYDFAVDGGVVGDIVMRGDGIPSGAIVQEVFFDVTTLFTGGGSCTVAAKLQSAADVQAAAAVTGAPWSTTGVKNSSALTATSTKLKLTADRQLTLTVAVAAVTAGKATGYVNYV